MSELIIRNKAIIHVELLKRFVDHGRFRVRVIRSESSKVESEGALFSLGITESFTRCRRPGERAGSGGERGRSINLHCLVFVCYERRADVHFLSLSLSSHLLRLRSQPGSSDLALLIAWHCER